MACCLGVRLGGTFECTGWPGESPDQRITGGRIISSETKPGANRAVAALGLAANAPLRSDSTQGAFLRRRNAQLSASNLNSYLLRQGNRIWDLDARHSGASRSP